MCGNFPQNFLGAKILSWNLVPRIHHYLQVCNAQQGPSDGIYGAVLLDVHDRAADWLCTIPVGDLLQSWADGLHATPHNQAL